MNTEQKGMLSRRSFLRKGGLALSVMAVVPAVGHGGAAESPGIGCKVLETRVISQQVENYHGWPTATRRRDGSLLLVCSGGREGHVCPFGRVELMVSADEGLHWGWPQVILDTALDDRDAGVLETDRGSILVTTFTSLAYEAGLMKARARKSEEAGAWSVEKLDRWNAAYERLTEDKRKAQLGCWIIRSADGGVTWSTRYSSIVNSPHGPIQLRDGRLLYAGVELWGMPRRVGVCESRDNGVTWEWLANLPVRPGDTADQYHELHAVEATDGRVVLQIRNHNSANANETLQCESTDGGRTWSVPHTIGVWGLPSALTRLRNGELLMTYGHRRAPFGNQARVSRDAGKSWSEPVTISGDGTSGDLGYPSTVELKDGTLLTVWYELLKGSSKAVLRQARWQLTGA